jgi:hypothetical protein
MGIRDNVRLSLDRCPRGWIWSRVGLYSVRCLRNRRGVVQAAVHFQQFRTLRTFEQFGNEDPASTGATDQSGSASLPPWREPAGSTFGFSRCRDWSRGARICNRARVLVNKVPVRLARAYCSEKSLQHRRCDPALPIALRLVSGLRVFPNDP